MRAFVFSSNKLVKDFAEGSYLYRFPFEESDFMMGAKFCGFLKALVSNYVAFLFFRIKCYFLLQDPGFKQYGAYCTNLNHKHVLRIAWGCYSSETLLEYDDAYPVDFNDSRHFREGCIANYSTSGDDLLIPIHKTDNLKYTLPFYFKKKPPHFSYKFFFHFNYVLPVDIIDYSGETSMFKKLTTPPPPPFSVKHPILFELLLLKFNVLSFLLSTSVSHVYEFYSGGFLESILLRFKSILYIIWTTNCSKFWKEKSVASFWSFRMFLKFGYCNFRNFYSIKTFKFRFVYSSFYYNKIRNEVLSCRGLFFPNNFSFFLIKSFSYVLILLYIYFLVPPPLSAIADLELLFSVRAYIYSFLFLVVLGLIFYYIFVKLFLKIVKHFSLVTVDFSKWITTYFRLGRLISTILMQFFESFLMSFINILSFLLLLFFIKWFLPDLFYPFLLCNTFFVLFVFIDNFTFFINKFFFGSAAESLHETKFNSASLISFFPFLMLILFPLFNFVINSSLIFVYLLRSYMPSYSFSLNHPFARTLFRVPFVEFSVFDECCDKTLLLKRDPSEGGFEEKFKVRENFFPVYNLSYFFKFLLTRRGRMFELQYNYFDYKEFLRTNRGYKSKTYTFFPPRFIYTFMLFDLYLIWVVINFFTLLRFWCFDNFNVKLLRSFSSSSREWLSQPYYQFLVSAAVLKRFKFKNVAFSSSNLKWTSFICFDICLEENYYRNTFKVTKALFNDLIEQNQ